MKPLDNYTIFLKEPCLQWSWRSVESAFAQNWTTWWTSGSNTLTILCMGTAVTLIRFFTNTINSLAAVYSCSAQAVCILIMVMNLLPVSEASSLVLGRTGRFMMSWSMSGCRADRWCTVLILFVLKKYSTVWNLQMLCENVCLVSVIRCGCIVACTDPWNASTSLKSLKQQKLVCLDYHIRSHSATGGLDPLLSTTFHNLAMEYVTLLPFIYLLMWWHLAFRHRWLYRAREVSLKSYDSKERLLLIAIN